MPDVVEFRREGPIAVITVNNPPVNALNSAVNKYLGGAEMKQLLENEGAEAAPMTLAQLSDLLPKEVARYRKAAQAAGLQPQ